MPLTDYQLFPAMKTFATQRFDTDAELHAGITWWNLQVADFYREEYLSDAVPVAMTHLSLTPMALLFVCLIFISSRMFCFYSSLSLA
ncbi:hypothetical protein J6590_060337 [Homalodisca vitripennis]|nr:hypothetical protein J6590_060337 [Homalodisca vitripennis]